MKASRLPTPSTDSPDLDCKPGARKDEDFKPQSTVCPAEKLSLSAYLLLYPSKAFSRYSTKNSIVRREESSDKRRLGETKSFLRYLVRPLRELKKNYWKNNVVARSSLLEVKASRKRNDRQLRPILAYLLHLQTFRRGVL